MSNWFFKHGVIFYESNAMVMTLAYLWCKLLIQNWQLFDDVFIPILYRMRLFSYKRKEVFFIIIVGYYIWYWRLKTLITVDKIWTLKLNRKHTYPQTWAASITKRKYWPLNHLNVYVINRRKDVKTVYLSFDN